MKHRYGSDSTQLILTDKAATFYNGEEMTIFEHESREIDPATDRPDSVYRYSYIMSPTGRQTTSSGPESGLMTADELNAELESMYDDYGYGDDSDEE